MAEGGRRTVWILGAGFSRSLGGPLLTDLLSPPVNNLVYALYRENRYIGGDGDGDGKARNAADTVRRLYLACGAASEHAAIRVWEDAEQFLDQLDAAAHGGSESPAAKRLATASRHISGGSTPPLMRDAARRLVAAACCAFLKDADTTEERWQPYIDWVQALTEADTLVTFNYDRVLELTERVVIVDPFVDHIPPFKQPRAFKLHGSVDWHRIESDGGEVRYSPVRDSPEFALNCEGVGIGIATPGPTKRIAAQELGKLWSAALKRIQEAEVVVLVGFRFPPSDAEAREKLLEALSTNTATHVELHIVLGPDRGHRDVVRLEQLLRYALTKTGRDEIVGVSRIGMQLGGFVKTFALTTHALFAEDFFTVWSPDLLWPKGLTVMRLP